MKPLSKDWTAEDRLRCIAALLPDLQAAIYAGKYSQPGTPNITSLQHIINEPSSVLEDYRETLEKVVGDYEALMAQVASS